MVINYFILGIQSEADVDKLLRILLHYYERLVPSGFCPKGLVTVF